MDEARYPDHPGWKKTDTSKAAADDMAAKAPNLRDRVFYLIGTSPNGLTADEVADLMEKGLLTIRPRVSELVEKGEVVDSGRRRRLHSGKQGIVWIAAKLQLDLL